MEVILSFFVSRHETWISKGEEEDPWLESQSSGVVWLLLL